MTIVERLAKLRALMQAKGIDAYIVPTADFHQSEYVGEHFKARKFITGFSGSAGTAVITLTEAKLWTDGRYFLQAGQQLEGTTVDLMKMGEPGVPTITEYLKATIKAGETLGFDGRVIATGEGEEYEAIATAAGASIEYSVDLIDDIWEDRPVLSEEPVFLLDIKYTGESTADKLARIRKVMEEKGATAHVLTTLDDICWTLNMRGNDIEFFPLVLSYAIITMDKMDLYINESKLTDEIKATFAADGVNILPYNDVYEDIKKVAADEVLLIDPGKLNYALFKNIPDGIKTVNATNPEILMKSMKNPVEIANTREAEIKDSIAHVRYMKWLKENVGTMKITELSAEQKLDEFREEMGNFIRDSFAPITAFGPHGAIVHYESSPETDVELELGGMLLSDTGAGFMEGSTDITRTFAFGEIPQQQKDDFTLVCISNLNLANARFMYGCTGMNLDYLAREPFWQRNLNFNHGTGHGVGYLLNIHEGPAGFRWTARPNEIHVIEEGMIITDEPGLYIAGSHGIRIENELLVCKGEQNEYGQFMYFEPITFIPMDLDAINPDIMTEVDKKRLNDYHKKVFETLAPRLEADEVEWLKKYTRAI